MELKYIKDLKEHIGKEITLQGWVANKREGKGIAFIVFRDGTGFCQVVISEEDLKSTNFEDTKNLTLEASFSVTGKVIADEKQIGGFEINASSFELISESVEYPITNKEHGVDFLIENRHLWLRTRRQWAIMKVRNAAIFAIHKFFQEKNFTLMDSPIFTGSAGEGTSDLFETEYFGEKAYLAQTGQLYGEAAAMAHGLIYTFGPTFRAENSNTSRHLAEFWMIEPEVAFNNLDDNMDLAEDFIQYVIKYAMDKCGDDLKFLEGRLLEEEKSKPQAERSEMALLEKLNFVLENNFKRVSYTEAIDILRDCTPNKKKKFQYIINEWGADLQSEHERYLVEKHFKSPVILFDYPANIKAFYMRLNEDGKTVRAMDILFPGIGEIVGGSQREERFDVLVEKMKALGIDEEELWWYLDTRRFGSAVHSGFGLGFERLVLFVTGMTNIRDVIAFPRTPQNADF